MSTYFVTTTAASGTGSLLDAITQANNTTSGITEIDFHIGAQGVNSGVQMISPQNVSIRNGLPALTASGVFINGYSENQWQDVSSTSPLIELNGNGGSGGNNGLQLSGTNNIVSGLFITDFGLNQIDVLGSNNTIGGTATGAGNVILGNILMKIGYGVDIGSVNDGSPGVGASGVVVQGNSIESNGEGIYVLGSNNTIGGSVAGAGNVISDNLYGVLVVKGAGDTIRFNSIYSNGSTGAGPGIALSNGSNNDLAAPSLNSATLNDNTLTLTVTGTFTAATANVSYALDFYANPSGDAEGADYLGSLTVTPTSTGTQSFTFTTATVTTNPLITATLTDNSGDTSQFSNGEGALSAPKVARNPASVTVVANSDADFTASAYGFPTPTVQWQVSYNGGGTFTNIAGATSTTLTLHAVSTALNGSEYRAVFINSFGSATTSAATLTVTSAVPPVYYVTNAGNFGTGSLADAITQANNPSSGITEIDFELGIRGSGYDTVWQVIFPGILPALTANGVFINGYSENQWLGVTSNSPFIELNGVLYGGSKGDGLDLTGSNNTVSGLFITDFTNGIEVAGNNNTVGGAGGAGNVISGNSGDGVKIDLGGSGNQVLGDTIGVNMYDSAALSNSGNGIEVAGSNNTLGASWAVAPNEISGNKGDGVKLDSVSSGNVVMGNYIGTNLAGTRASYVSSYANSVGIEDGGSGNTIGGSVLGARNVISGNSTDGVLIDSTGTKETMQGNNIGTDYSATSAILGNGYAGVEIKGSGNTIGGYQTNAFIRNYIGGNYGEGVRIDSSASGNQVAGNFIGVDISGTNGVGNAIGIDIGGSSNTVGGTSAYYTNVISGSLGDGLSSDGVIVEPTGAGNLIQNNYVGTDYTGRSTLDNHGVTVGNYGIGLVILGSDNTVGAGNVISGNSLDGVSIYSTASGNLVLGSLIGLNLSGGGSNGGNGVNIAGNNNTIGGTVTAARNIISGNTADGVLIDSGASGNQVLGDWIGTSYTGTAATANSIGVEVAGNSNTVGGAGGAGNVISGNSGDGVKIDFGGSGNQVLGDTIGVNYYDGAALANSGNGIEVAGSNNTLGASWAVAANEVSGNSGDGVKLDSGSSGNVVLGSYIGTNLAGTSAFANSVGIEDGGSGNTIGGSVLGAKNVISGNSTDGVLIDSTAANETMLGNYIGTDYSASTSLANGSNGVEIQGSGNTIGGQLVSSLVRNLIDGNTKGDGVKIDSGANGNQVLGNFIGVNVSGTVGLANSIGVEVGGSNNTIGGPTNLYTNVISGNSGDGVLIDSTGASNFIESSFVGTDYTGTAALGNSGSGIAIAGNNNTVYAGNVIAYNSNNGVLVSAGSGNMIRQNSIYANTGLGISLASGANNNIAAPTISTATLSSGTLTVTGSFTATVGETYALEFFANPSGDGEGKIFLGSLPVTAASTTQDFTFITTTTVIGSDPLITATLTDNFGVGDTSAFSNGVTAS